MLIAAGVLSAAVVACKKDPVTPPEGTPDVHLDKGLMLYLPFDGNFADSSGNANQTTVVGGAALTYDEHGYTQRAYGATGNGEALLVTNNGSIKLDTAFTISYNFMIRSKQRMTFLSMVNYTTGHSPSFITGTNAPGSPLYQFNVFDSSNTCGTWGYQTPITSGDSVKFEPQLESWYNAICIYHNSEVKVYINGRLVMTRKQEGSKALLCPDEKVVIGSWWTVDPISINGKLDEVRMYNRVLTPDEIAELSKDFAGNDPF